MKFYMLCWCDGLDNKGGTFHPTSDLGFIHGCGVLDTDSYELPDFVSIFFSQSAGLVALSEAEHGHIHLVEFDTETCEYSSIGTNGEGKL